MYLNSFQYRLDREIFPLTDTIIKSIKNNNSQQKKEFVFQTLVYLDQLSMNLCNVIDLSLNWELGISVKKNKVKKSIYMLQRKPCDKSNSQNPEDNGNKTSHKTQIP